MKATYILGLLGLVLNALLLSDVMGGENDPAGVLHTRVTGTYGSIHGNQCYPPERSDTDPLWIEVDRNAVALFELDDDREEVILLPS